MSPTEGKQESSSHKQSGDNSTLSNSTSRSQCSVFEERKSFGDLATSRIVRPVSLSKMDADSATSSPNSAFPRSKSHAVFKKFTLADFEPISKLGRGAYSTVVLVEEICSKTKFAMKVMEKAFLEKVII